VTANDKTEKVQKRDGSIIKCSIYLLTNTSWKSNLIIVLCIRHFLRATITVRTCTACAKSDLHLVFVFPFLIDAYI